MPQHLEVEDVLAWGMSATDLIWLVGPLAAAWWIYFHLPAPLPVRIAVTAPPAVLGCLLGPAQFGGRSLRGFASALLAFISRPRCQTYGGKR